MEGLVCRQEATSSFNIAGIEASLREVRTQWPLLHRELKLPQERIDDEVLDNLMSGYALVSQLLEAKIELFAFGGSSYLLELNNRVLCGTSEQKRREYRKHIAATDRHFYERADAGIQDLMDWYARHRHESVWHRAAGLYIRILSEPQLFIEGNDRTSALVMSYILAREGHPPFVLTTLNAKAYFEFSALVKRIPRNSLANLFRLPRLKARIAGFLKDQASGCRP